METKMKAQLTLLVAVLACAGCKSPSTANTTKYEDPMLTRLKEKQRKDGPVPELDLKAPADATAADLEATAKAMTDRAASYGYKGVTAQVTQDGAAARVRLSCPTGITKEMRKVLRMMGTIGGRQVEIRMHYRESQAEREQNLYTPENKKTPPGAKWYQQFSFADPEEEFGMGRSWGGGPRLLMDEPVLRPPALRGPAIDYQSYSFETDVQETGTPNWKFGVLVVDERIFAESLRSYPGAKTKLRLHVSDDSGAVGHCLKFPMPLRLDSMPSSER